MTAWRMPSFTKQIFIGAATLFLALGLSLTQISNAEAHRRDGRIVAGIIAGVAVGAILARKHRRSYRRHYYRRGCDRYRGYWARRNCYKRRHHRRRHHRRRHW